MVVLPMRLQRFPQLSEEQIMVIAGIPREEIRHSWDLDSGGGERSKPVRQERVTVTSASRC